jgi:hypothetical protein
MCLGHWVSVAGEVGRRGVGGAMAAVTAYDGTGGATPACRGRAWTDNVDQLQQYAC